MTPSLPQTIDGIVYDFATTHDESPILDLLVSDFCLTEPLNEVMAIKPEESAPALALLARRALSDGISFKMTDEKTGAVVGIQLSFLCDKFAKEKDDQDAEKVLSVVPDRLQPLATFVGEVAGQDAPDVFEAYGVDKYVDFFVVNIHKDYRGRNIAQTIMTLSYEVFRQKGFKIVKVLATNPRTEHVFRNKQGFQEVASYKVLDYLHEGKPFFQGVKELDTAYTFIKDLSL